MESNPFTKHGKGLSFEVRDIIVEKWLESTKPFQRAAVKFTEKDSFKYFRSVRTCMKRSTRNWWEQVTNNKIGLCCPVHGVLQTSKAKYVCCGSTKAVNRKSGCLTRQRALSSFDKSCIDMAPTLTNKLLTDWFRIHLFGNKCLIILPIELLCMWAIFIPHGSRTRIFMFVYQEITRKKAPLVVFLAAVYL